jgi:hypothetical protein
LRWDLLFRLREVDEVLTAPGGFNLVSAAGSPSLSLLRLLLTTFKLTLILGGMGALAYLAVLRH